MTPPLSPEELADRLVDIARRCQTDTPDDPEAVHHAFRDRALLFGMTLGFIDKVSPETAALLRETPFIKSAIARGSR